MRARPVEFDYRILKERCKQPSISRIEASLMKGNYRAKDELVFANTLRENREMLKRLRDHQQGVWETFDIALAVYDALEKSAELSQKSNRVRHFYSLLRKSKVPGVRELAADEDALRDGFDTVLEELERSRTSPLKTGRYAPGRFAELLGMFFVGGGAAIGLSVGHHVSDVKFFPLLGGLASLGAFGGAGVAWAARRRLLNKYAANLGLREKPRRNLWEVFRERKAGQFGEVPSKPAQLTIREFRKKGVLTKAEIEQNLHAIDEAITRHEQAIKELRTRAKGRLERVTALAAHS